MATPFFSNQPLFCQKPGSVEGVFAMEQFNALTAANLACTAQDNACMDPNLGTTFIKNVVNQVIRCGGRNIDINFFMDLFGGTPRPVDSKRIFNHYICDADMNIYAAASREATSAGTALTFQVLKQNHSASGTESLPATGFLLMDKDRQIMYQITDVDTTLPYAHKVTILPTDKTVTAEIRANTPYFVIPARMVGGCSCPEPINSTFSIGYSKEVKPLRVRRDWKLCIDVLRSYMDKIQYAVIYDMNGKAYDSWDVFEAMEARQAVRIALNILSFVGTPVTNPSLISGVDAVVDDQHTGFYGMFPSIENGGGIVQNYNSAIGFDLEADGEPIFLYQDSLKRSNNFLFLAGQKFLFGLDNRANKMVRRTQGEANLFEAYRRMGDWLTPVEVQGGKSYVSELAKIGVKSYDYRGFGLDFKKVDAFSDKRYFGSDFYSGTAIGMPMEGATNGQGNPVSAIEYYEYGNNGWTGGYEEFQVDFRKVDMCENLGGYSAQSIMMAMHCPNLWALIKPAQSA